MIRLIITTLFFSFTFSSFAQTGCFGLPDSVLQDLGETRFIEDQFSMDLPELDLFIPLKTLQSSDGDVIILYQGFLNGSTIAGNFLISYTNDGNLIFNTHIGDLNFITRAVDFSKDEEDNFFVLSNENKNIILTKIDSNGNLVWVKTYGEDLVSSATAMAIDELGDLIIAGIQEEDTQNESHIILKISNDGTEIWENETEIPIDAIAIANNEDILCAGTRFDEIERNNEIAVLRLDSTGNKIWERNYGSSSHDSAYGIAETEDNEIIILGFVNRIDQDVFSTSVLLNGPWLIKCSAEGDLINSRFIEYTNSDALKSIRKSPRGFLLIGSRNNGTYRNLEGMVNTDNQVALIEIDNNLESISEQSFGSTSSDIGLDGFANETGDIFLLGIIGGSNLDVNPNFRRNSGWIVNLSAPVLDLNEIGVGQDTLVTCLGDTFQIQIPTFPNCPDCALNWEGLTHANDFNQVLESDTLLNLFVTDPNGCQGVSRMYLRPVLLTAEIEDIVSSNCNIDNGAATLEYNSNANNISINWDNGSNLETATELSAGIHQVTITAEQGCTKILEVPIELTNELKEIEWSIKEISTSIIANDNNYVYFQALSDKYIFYFHNGKLIKSDLNGNVIWENQQETNRFQAEYLALSNGGLVTYQFLGTGDRLIYYNNEGSIIFDRIIGNDEAPARISEAIETDDGGVIFFGEIRPANDTTVITNGSSDISIFKIDQNGQLLWTKNIGDSGTNRVYFSTKLKSGNFIVVTNSHAEDGDVPQNYGEQDTWALLIDQSGNILNSLVIGSSGVDVFRSFTELENGEFIFSITSEGGGGLMPESFGDIDAWILKTDSDLNIIWNKVFGGSKRDFLEFEIELNTGELIFPGTSYSSDGTVPFGFINNNWILKLDLDGNLLLSSNRINRASLRYQFSLLPDGSYYESNRKGFVAYYDHLGNRQWKTYLPIDSTDVSYGLDVLLTADGGLIYSRTGQNIVAGSTYYRNAPRLTTVKISKKGEIEWVTNDFAGEIYETSDGGYLVSSEYNSIEGPYGEFITSNFYELIKFHPINGAVQINSLLPDTLVNCPGFPIILDAESEDPEKLNGTEILYHWSTGDTTAQISIDTEGQYIVEATLNGACTFTSNTVLVLSPPDSVCAQFDTVALSLCYGDIFKNSIFFQDSIITDTIFSYPNNKITTYQISVQSSPYENIPVIEAHVCTNEPFFEVLQESPDSTVTLEEVDSFGCRTIQTIKATSFGMEETEYLELYICPGDTVEHLGVSYTEPDIYEITLDSVGYCDSKLFIRVNENSEEEIYVRISLNLGGIYNGNPYFQDTMITEIFENQFGCDSIVNSSISILSGLSDELKNEWNLQIFPNPAYEVLNLKWESPTHQELSIEVFDATGRLIKNAVSNQNFTAGNNQEQIDLEELPPGIYLLRIRSDEGFLYHQFSKFK